MSEVCLVSTPSRAFNHYRPPMALMYIAAYLEEKGICTNIIDLKLDDPIASPGKKEKEKIANDVIKEILRMNPHIIGIPCCTPEFNEVMRIATEIKENNPSCVIIVGGTHPTLMPEDFFFEQTPVDYAVIGEGEVTTYELIQAIRQKEDVGNIEGIGYFDQKDKCFKRTEPRPLIQDLDSLPFPAFDKVDMGYYTTPSPYSVRGVMLSSFYILYGRGCPSSCTFCVSKNLRKAAGPGRFLRFRSPKNVADEIEYLTKKYKIDGFYIIDDAFTLQPTHAIEFCDELISRKLNLIWACETRVNRVNTELLKKMRKAGCIQVDFGVESGSPECLKRVKKGITVDQIKDAFAACKKVGIRTFANILINLPGETEDELKQTFDLLEQIKPTVTSFNTFTPYVGTDIYDNWQVKLSPKDYSILGEPPLQLVTNPQFRFADHQLDLEEFYRANHKKYNSLKNSIGVLASTGYIKCLLKSRKKAEYGKQLGNLFREMYKQKARV